MTAIQFETKNEDIVAEFMQWFFKHSKEDVKLTFVKDFSAKLDENGIEYVSDEEQKIIEMALSNPDCHLFGHTKTITIDM